MSNYQQYLTDTSRNPEIADYGVDDFIDDVEETLNLKGKGYIACLKKIMFDAKEMIILKKQIEEDKKHLDSLVKNMVCHYDKELNELKKQLQETKASEQLASHVAKVNAEDIVELRKENEEHKERMGMVWKYVESRGVDGGLNLLLNPEKFASSEEEEEEDLYADDDDWVWGYGNKKDVDEYVIHISGGGDPNTPNGFEDWVIKKNIKNELEYFIRHGGGIPDKKQVGEKLVSCPEGKYVSWQDVNYEFREGEMDFEWLLDDEDFKSYQEE